jgi:anti-sigma B factor antagonist
MEITVTPHDGYVLATLSGPMGEESRDLFREQLHPLIGESGARFLIDLSDVQRINSPGVGSLVALVADANTHGGRVILCNPSSFVTVVLNVTRLNTFFEIAATVEEGRERLSGGLAGRA